MLEHQRFKEIVAGELVMALDEVEPYQEKVAAQPAGNALAEQLGKAAYTALEGSFPGVWEPVEVQLLTADGRLVDVISTDEERSIPLRASQARQVQAAPLGHAFRERGGDAMSVLDQPTDVDVTVAPYETAQVETPISPEQEAYVKLDVVDESGEAQPGALVSLDAPSVAAIVRRTDNEGKATLKAVPEEVYQVHVNPPGALLVERVRPDGMGFEHVWGTMIQPKWTSIAAFDLDKRLYLLTYDNSSGDVAISRMATDLVGIEQVWSDNWLSGWTCIRPFASEGDVYLVESKPDEGAFVIDRIKPDGLGVEEVWDAEWTTGWGVIRPFLLGVDWYLFEYKPASGTVVVDRWKQGFKGVQEVWRDTWTKGWEIEVFYESKRPHLLEYKPSSGRLVIDRIKDNGKGVDELLSSTWQRRAPAYPFVLNASTYSLSYLRDEKVMVVDSLELGNGGSGAIAEKWRSNAVFPYSTIAEWKTISYVISHVGVVG